MPTPFSIDASYCTEQNIDYVIVAIYITEDTSPPQDTRVKYSLLQIVLARALTRLACQLMQVVVTRNVFFS